MEGGEGRNEANDDDDCSIFSHFPTLLLLFSILRRNTPDERRAKQAIRIQLPLFSPLARQVTDSFFPSDIHVAAVVIFAWRGNAGGKGERRKNSCSCPLLIL